MTDLSQEEDIELEIELDDEDESTKVDDKNVTNQKNGKHKWSEHKEFEDALRECLTISKSKIAIVTQLSIKHLNRYKDIVHYIEKFIRKGKTVNNTKLPQLFIIDSICRAEREHKGKGKNKNKTKNSKFSRRFGRNIDKTFHALCRGPDSDKPCLKRVFTLWHKEKWFPNEKMKQIILAIKEFHPKRKHSKKHSKRKHSKKRHSKKMNNAHGNGNGNGLLLKSLQSLTNDNDNDSQSTNDEYDEYDMQIKLERLKAKKRQNNANHNNNKRKLAHLQPQQTPPNKRLKIEDSNRENNPMIHQNYSQTQSPQVPMPHMVRPMQGLPPHLPHLPHQQRPQIQHVQQMQHMQHIMAQQPQMTQMPQMPPMQMIPAQPIMNRYIPYYPMPLAMAAAQKQTQTQTQTQTQGQEQKVSNGNGSSNISISREGGIGWELSPDQLRVSPDRYRVLSCTIYVGFWNDVHVDIDKLRAEASEFGPVLKIMPHPTKPPHKHAFVQFTSRVMAENAKAGLRKRFHHLQFVQKVGWGRPPKLVKESFKFDSGIGEILKVEAPYIQQKQTKTNTNANANANAITNANFVNIERQNLISNAHPSMYKSQPQPSLLPHNPYRQY